MNFKLVKVILSIIMFSILIQSANAIEYNANAHKKVFTSGIKYYLITDKTWIQTLYRQDNNYSPKMINGNEPSKIIRPEFYEKNELNFLFDNYKYIRDKIENPVTITNKSLINSVEMSMVPRIGLPGLYNMSYAKLNVFIEFKASFL